MSIIIASYILFHSLINLNEILAVFLEKTPKNIDIICLKNHLLNIKGIIEVHHFHVWSIDGVNNYATLHVVTNETDAVKIKLEVKKILKYYNITHTTIEFEKEGETCLSKNCEIDNFK